MHTPALTGMKNRTQHSRKTPHSPYGYRKRYPAHQCERPRSTRVSKTIPTQSGVSPHHTKMHTPALTGMKNRTQAYQGNSPLLSRVSKTIPCTLGKLPTALMGIENDTPHINVNAHGQHGYRKRYPAHQCERPRSTRVSKTIPTQSGVSPHHTQMHTPALTGMKNRTQHSRKTPHSPHGYRKQYPHINMNAHGQHGYEKSYPSIPRKLPTALTGIENDTQHTRETPHSPHGYRKRYPAHQGNSPPPLRVSKTIPYTKDVAFDVIFCHCVPFCHTFVGAKPRFWQKKC